jgi:WXG100 family type VII secretion target
MSSGLRTGISTMDTAAQHVDDVNQQVQSRLRTLQGQVEQAMAGWKGSGSASWRSLMNRYDADAQQLNTALQTIAVRMRDNRKGYQQVQAQVVQGANSIANQLQG